MKKLILATALLLPFASQASTVDGDLSDLINDINNLVYGQPYNGVSGFDSTGGDGDGFNIQDMYAHYDVQSDALFIGANFLSTIGDSEGSNDVMSGAFDAPFDAFNPFGLGGSISTFDNYEAYGFGLATTGGEFIRVDFIGGGLGAAETANVFSLTYDFAYDGSSVEFAIYGLDAAGALGNFSFTNPTDLDINFYAGTAANSAAEDIGTLNMQVVPVPAAAWLFLSGLAGLVGVSRKRAK